MSGIDSLLVVSGPLRGTYVEIDATALSARFEAQGRSFVLQRVTVVAPNPDTGVMERLEVLDHTHQCYRQSKDSYLELRRPEMFTRDYTPGPVEGEVALPVWDSEAGEEEPQPIEEVSDGEVEGGDVVGGPDGWVEGASAGDGD